MADMGNTEEEVSLIRINLQKMIITQVYNKVIIRKYLKYLNEMDLSLEIIRDTGINLTLSALLKETSDPDLIDCITYLGDAWKNKVKEEEAEEQAEADAEMATADEVDEQMADPLKEPKIINYNGDSWLDEYKKLVNSCAQTYN